VTDRRWPDGTEYHKDEVLIYEAAARRNPPGGKCYISVAFLMSYFNVTLDMFNNELIPPHILVNEMDMIGNPDHPNKATKDIHKLTNNHQGAKVGKWMPRERKVIKEVRSVKDAQDFCVLESDATPLIKAICRVFEGPSLERSNLGEKMDDLIQHVVATEACPDPVFEYLVNVSPKHYKIWSLVDIHADMHAKKDADVTTFVRSISESASHQAIIDTAGLLGILRLRRLKPNQGGNTIVLKQQNRIHETTGLLYPVNRLVRTQDQRVDFRSQVAKAGERKFGNNDMDFIVAKITKIFTWWHESATSCKV